MRCLTCGADISEDETVCPECGMEISGEQPAEVAQVPQQGESPLLHPEPVVVAPPLPPSPAVAPSPTAAGRLLLKRGGILTGEEFAIGTRVVIGRFHEETGPVDVDLARLPEAGYVTRRHAEIYQDASGQWFVRDLGSKNGTFVRSSAGGQVQRLAEHQPTVIKDGDEVAFGNAWFVFRTQG